jgi:hypothetical protein
MLTRLDLLGLKNALIKTYLKSKWISHSLSLYILIWMFKKKSVEAVETQINEKFIYVFILKVSFSILWKIS